MTISTTVSRNNYTASGNDNIYIFTFKIFSQDDLLVTVRDTDGDETTLTKTTDYTVGGSLADPTGGFITLVDNGQAWLSGGDLIVDYVISIRRVRDIIQETDIRNQGAFYPEVHEDQFDIATMIDLQQQDAIDRSIKLGESVDPADFNNELPASFVGAAGKALVTNATGDGWDLGPDADAISGAQAEATAAAASAAAALVSENAADASAIAAALSETNAAASAVAADASADAAAASAAIAVGSVVIEPSGGSYPLTLDSSYYGKVILVDTSAARTINLHDAATNFKITIKDITGLAGTNAITLDPFGAHEIEGVAANYLLESNFGTWTFIFDGTSWWLTN
jgi:hypothetical protein